MNFPLFTYKDEFNRLMTQPKNEMSNHKWPQTFQWPIKTAVIGTILLYQLSCFNHCKTESKLNFSNDICGLAISGY